MNPALPTAVLLSLAGLVLDRRRSRSGGGWGAGVAWAVVGLAGAALLAPALMLPTGVPSPAASLALDPPWQGVADPAAGNRALRDVTYQIQPWLLFLRGELRSGRLPLWNPHQYAGTPFWGNGQAAPLFPLHLLFAALPLGLGLTLLPWLRFLVAGTGAFALARALGVGRRGALLAALVYPLSGMLVSYLLYPMGNALALVPWVLAAVERLAAGSGGWPALALASGLQLLAGHPETALHTALLAGLYLAVRGGPAPGRAWAGFVGGWVGGAALAAAALVPFVLTLGVSSRWAWRPETAGPPLTQVLLFPLRLVLPGLYGDPARGTWFGPFNYLATAVYAGALALPLAAAGLTRARRDRRWLALAAVGAFAFLAAYQLPGVRHLLEALPVVDRALHHRLIFGVELVLALAAGAGLEAWREGRGRSLLAGSGLAALLLGVAWWRFAGEWSRRGLVPGHVAWTALVLALGLLLAGSLVLPEAVRRRLWPVVPVLFALDLVAAHGRTNPGLPLERLYPRTGAVELLAGRPGRVAGLDRALHPNAATVYGLYDVRGDDPVKLASYETLFARDLGRSNPVGFAPVERWRSPRLDRLGVRWVVAGPGEPPPVADWRLAYDGADARVFERPTALPLARWAGASEGYALEVVGRRPGRWEVDYHCPGPGTLVIAEAWAPGWRAQVDGRPVPLAATPGGLLGVEIGPGSGRLVVGYRPPGLVLGGWLSGLALAAIGAAAAWRRLHARGTGGAGQ